MTVATLEMEAVLWNTFLHLKCIISLSSLYKFGCPKNRNMQNQFQNVVWFMISVQKKWTLYCKITKMKIKDINQFMHSGENCVLSPNWTISAIFVWISCENQFWFDSVWTPWNEYLYRWMNYRTIQIHYWLRMEIDKEFKLKSCL